MIIEIYKKIRKPLSVAFSCLGLMIFIDYFLPKIETICVVKSSEIEANIQRRGKMNHLYSYKVNYSLIRTTKTGYYQVYDDDTVLVRRTLLLRTIHTIEKNGNSLIFLQAPNSFFPFFPLCLLFAFPIQLARSSITFYLVAQPVSIVVNCIIILMIMF
jgi:hypothetical protein